MILKENMLQAYLYKNVYSQNHSDEKYSHTFSEPRKRKLHGEQNNVHMHIPRKTFLLHELLKALKKYAYTKSLTPVPHSKVKWSTL